MMKRFVWIVLVVFGTHLSAQENKVPPVTAGFSYKGQQISPSCFAAFMGDNMYGGIWLNTDPCQQTQSEDKQLKMKDGFIGFEPLDKDSPGSYVYYKHLGRVHFEGFERPFYNLIEVQYSGGGTGQFTSIDLVKLEGDELRLVDSIDGGDRCNGGLSEIHYYEGTLAYKKHLTPLDLYSRFQEQTNNGPNFLECATCCLGTIRIKGGELKTFEFDANVLENRNSDPKSQQSCFNGIVKETIEAGKTLLTADELKAFTLRVKDRCVSQ